MNKDKIQSYSDEEYKYMDYIINITFINLASLSKNFNGVQFYGFNYSNKEHLFLLNAAYIYRRITGKNICINGHYFNTLKWNFKHRKKEKRIFTSKKRKNNYKDINVEEILNFMRPTLNEKLKDFNYEDIYNAYYREEQ